MSNKDRRKMKDILFIKCKGLCEYCGIEMEPYAKNGEQPKDNSATIDHKYSRNHPNRRNFVPGERVLFCVCNKCNREKSWKEHRLLPKEHQEDIQEAIKKFNWLSYSSDDLMDLEKVLLAIEEKHKNDPSEVTSGIAHG